MSPDRRHALATELAARATGRTGSVTDGLRDRLLADGDAVLDLAARDMDAAVAVLVRVSLLRLEATVDVVCAARTAVA